MWGGGGVLKGPVLCCVSMDMNDACCGFSVGVCGE